MGEKVLETLVLVLFALALTICIILDVSIIYALIFGYLLFCLYGLIRRFTVIQLIKMSINGLVTVKNILILFILIGMLTALWRTSGTIPVIVSYSIKFLSPSIFILMTFILNCIVSFLIGTAFGTAATMGVITMTMAVTMKINPVLIGGAMLSGIFFGDRCSPVSTSSNLVAELTETDLYDNIKEMMKTALVPFIATCIVYYFMGRNIESGSEMNYDVVGIFSNSFNLSYIALIPALSILLLSFFKVKVKLTILISVILAFILSLTIQHMPISYVLESMVFGYTAPDAQLGEMLNGGGIMSMLNVFIIICISSTYAGIFDGTGLLNDLKYKIKKLSKRTSMFNIILGTSIVASMIACNQTLAVLLTFQVLNDIQTDKKQFAIDIENTTIVVAPLVPWSIASAAPLTTIGAPTSSILFAVYLYVIPIWRFILQSVLKKK